MKLITEQTQWLQQHAALVHDEILADLDVHEYWHPKIVEEYWPENVPKHQTFEQAYMKFLNGNLNYYHFPNMVAHSVEQDGWNAAFPKTIQFCSDLRKITSNRGPFGRMCVWNLPPGRRLLPHVDDFEYHRHIVRNIFVVSPDMKHCTKIVIDGVETPTAAGTLFQFQPHRQQHEFVNTSPDKNWYFLGFDYWIVSRLEEAKSRVNIQDVINDPDRMRPIGDTYMYGSMNTRCKYQSAH